MLENPLSYERFAEHPREKVLRVLLQHDDVAVLRLHLAVVAY